MKKVLSLVAVVALAASFTACKKDWTCSCTYTYTVGDTEYTYDYSYDYLKTKKKDAQEACDYNASLVGSVH
jgi:hypothetical protein